MTRQPQNRLIARVIRQLVVQVAVKELNYDTRSLNKLRRQRNRHMDEALILLSRLGWVPGSGL